MEVQQREQAPGRVTECGKWMQVADPGSPVATIHAGIGEPASQLTIHIKGKAWLLPAAASGHPVCPAGATLTMVGLGPGSSVDTVTGFLPWFHQPGWGTVPGGPRQTLPRPCSLGPAWGRRVGKEPGCESARAPELKARPRDSLRPQCRVAAEPRAREMAEFQLGQGPETME